MVKTYNGVNNSVDGPRANVGKPSGQPYRTGRSLGKSGGGQRNDGAGYADGNCHKSNYVPKNNGGGSGY